MYHTGESLGESSRESSRFLSFNYDNSTFHGYIIATKGIFNHENKLEEFSFNSFSGKVMMSSNISNFSKGTFTICQLTNNQFVCC